ncbi:aminotransferase class I/II-fold pyridoxal phosphate-dependent enzyme [Dyadobacter fermentans]|uniref:Aminotransferase class I and II n=1 Tax=Dyadobacter fermentans (strain ATCC 700827 / DSM 18053 / CIP 107007 / KCTC 52180 / NS114) TaxID=471854 RepID=C6VXR0_DYAFD|nr:aminotransferase class I/II-fold pyridoxal phosphate-dependent enzyme [Dyadobacter fermentans]ACT95093.1 aminotransferase class I and II [Dyadobacter fermentans DSM 18053]
MNTYHTSKLPGRIVETTDGAQFLWFSGTDYLGMGHDEDLRRYLSVATESFGNHYGSSRNNSLRLDIYENAERQLAVFLQSDSALIVSCGMWAGQLLMKEIENIVQQAGKTAQIAYHYAPGVHPALWGNAFDRNNGEWSDWATKTVSKINAAEPNTAHIICTNAVGSPMVKAFDFSLFNTIPQQANVWLLVDESHSLGIVGAGGNGVAERINPQLLQQTIFVSSLNKALGIPAGAVWGSENVIESLRKSPWFAGASPPAPAYAYALKMLLEQNKYAAARATLMEKVRYFNAKMNGILPFQTVPDYPVFCSLNAALFDHLLNNGIMASCFSYPSPTDTPVTRIAISSLHQKEDLDRLAEVCKQFFA